MSYSLYRDPPVLLLLRSFGGPASGRCADLRGLRRGNASGPGKNSRLGA